GCGGFSTPEVFSSAQLKACAEDLRPIVVGAAATPSPPARSRWRGRLREAGAPRGHGERFACLPDCSLANTNSSLNLNRCANRLCAGGGDVCFCPPSLPPGWKNSVPAASTAATKAVLVIFLPVS